MASLNYTLRYLIYSHEKVKFFYVSMWIALQKMQNAPSLKIHYERVILPYYQLDSTVQGSLRI